MGEAAQRINTAHLDELLDILNIAFAEEWLSYYQYWIGSKVVEGPMRKVIQKELSAHAQAELKHATLLSARIIQLGGVPVLDPGDLENIALCQYVAPSEPLDIKLLRQNLSSERCAIKRYQEICEMCFEKDFETFEISRQILHDELEHEQDLEDFLKDINSLKILIGQK